MLGFIVIGALEVLRNLLKRELCAFDRAVRVVNLLLRGHNRGAQLLIVKKHLIIICLLCADKLGVRRIHCGFRRLNRGVESVVEIILIIVVLVGLVMLFRDQITDIVNSLFEKITDRTEKF